MKKPGTKTTKTPPPRIHLYLDGPRRAALTKVLRLRGWPRRAGMSVQRIVTEALDRYLDAQMAQGRAA